MGSPSSDSATDSPMTSPVKRRRKKGFEIGQVVFLENNERRKAAWLPAVVRAKGWWGESLKVFVNCLQVQRLKGSWQTLLGWNILLLSIYQQLIFRYQCHCNHEPLAYLCPSLSSILGGPSCVCCGRHWSRWQLHLYSLIQGREIVRAICNVWSAHRCGRAAMYRGDSRVVAVGGGAVPLF